MAVLECGCGMIVSTSSRLARCLRCRRGLDPRHEIQIAEMRVRRLATVGAGEIGIPDDLHRHDLQRNEPPIPFWHTAHKKH